MKGNYRMTWERGYHWCRFRGWAEGCFSGVIDSLSRGTWVSDLGELGTKAIVSPLICKEAGLSLSLFSPQSLLLPSNPSVLSKWSLFPFRSLLPFPFCLLLFPTLLLSGVINNEWSGSSIDPIFFVLAQQKISNLSEDLKITLQCGGNGSGRVCKVKGRGLFFLRQEDRS